MKNKNIFFGLLTFILIVVAGIFLISGEDNSTVKNNQGDVQIVKLWVEGANYVLSPDELKKDIPVRIEADMSKIPGCSRSIVIPAFNVRKTVSNSDNIIEFTPTKTGTFTIACSMNMYTGSFTVR